MKMIASFLKDENGAAAVEYGILLGAIAAGIIISAYSIGGKVSAFFTTTDSLIP